VVAHQRLSQRAAQFVQLREIVSRKPCGSSGIVRGEPSQHFRNVAPTVGAALKVLTVEHTAHQFEWRWCLSIERPATIGEDKAHSVPGVFAKRHEC
jgi:hypothetical protein